MMSAVCESALKKLREKDYRVVAHIEKITSQSYGGYKYADCYVYNNRIQLLVRDQITFYIRINRVIRRTPL